MSHLYPIGPATMLDIVHALLGERFAHVHPGYLDPTAAVALGELRVAQMELVLLGAPFRSEAAADRLMDLGYLPATPMELKVCAAFHGMPAEAYSIAAVGAPILDADRVPRAACIYQDPGKRRLTRAWWGTTWGSGTRYLAARV